MYTCDMSRFLCYLFIISSILTVADGGSNDIYEQSQMVAEMTFMNSHRWWQQWYLWTVADGGSNDIHEQSQMVAAMTFMNSRRWWQQWHLWTVADGGSNDIYEQSQMVLSQIAINWKPYICTEN